MKTLSVLLSTRNGAHVLPQVLSGYAACEPPVHPWQIIIVDNGSDDGTADILAGYRDKLPLTILQEPLPGKNRALNVGLALATGDLLVITDDDAIPARNFLKAWEALFDTRPEYAVFGGSIAPLFPDRLPSLIAEAQDYYAELFAANNAEAGPIDFSRIYGPNMAVRRTVFEAGHRFNEDIGPNWADQAYAMGSETEFCERMADAGYLFWFHDTACVRHIVRAQQLTTDYFEKRASRHGRGTALRLKLQKEHQKSNLLKRWARLLKWKVQGLTIQFARRVPSAQPKVLWHQSWQAAFYKELARPNR